MLHVTAATAAVVPAARPLIGAWSHGARSGKVANSEAMVPVKKDDIQNKDPVSSQGRSSGDALPTIGLLMIRP